MRLFIFRIAKGERAGIVEASCPMDFQQKKIEIEKKIQAIKQGKIDYENNGYITYLHEELWKHGRARQGWGIEGLDLRDGFNNWIENYLIGLKKYWNLSLEEIKSYDSCKEASGRFHMFDTTMGKMEKGDILIIPTHSANNHYDNKYLTVATVAGEYNFDLNMDFQDFGHAIPVENLKVVAYNHEIKPKDFTGYYQRAVTELKESYKLYNPLLSFIKKNYFD